MDEPPRASKIGNRLIGPELDRYLVEQVIDRSEKMFAEREWVSFR